MPAATLHSLLKGMTKQEIIKYSQIYCKHRHPILAHPACLAKLVGIPERTGFLDIEASNLSASFGVAITWCIKKYGGEILEDHITEQDFENENGQYDRRLLESCVKAMLEFDRLIVYWGKDRRFDIPFLRTRALTMDIRFPLYQERIVNDLYDTVKNKLRLGRNSLASACTQFGIGSKETPLSPQTWMDATIGRKSEAIQTILQHNREDVVSTEQLWVKLNGYSSSPKTSI